jgi:hypothetical protein
MGAAHTIIAGEVEVAVQRLHLVWQHPTPPAAMAKTTMADVGLLQALRGTAQAHSPGKFLL